MRAPRAARAKERHDDWGSAESALLEARRGHIKVKRVVQRSASLAAQQTWHARNRAIARRMNAELAERKGWSEETKQSVLSAPAASRDALREASVLYNDAMARLSKGESLQWFKLFRTIDEDDSGLIQYGEFVRLTRSVLRIGEWELPLRELNAAWRVIDEDGSGQVTAGEFGKFMRLGQRSGRRRRSTRRRSRSRASTSGSPTPRATAASRSPRRSRRGCGCSGRRRSCRGRSSRCASRCR